ncbi:MAG: amidohydrolase family protein [Actinomycetes bacterium]
MHTIDIHNHFVPPEVVTETRAGTGVDGLRIDRIDGQEWVVHRQGFRWPLHRTFFEVEERLRAMDGLGIDTAVTSLAPTLFLYGMDDTAALVDHCTRANDALATFSKESGGRIEALATLPMADPDAAVRELHRAVTGLGFSGAQIGPRVEDVPLDDPGVRPVLRAAAELGVPLVLHPYSPGLRAGLTDFYLTNLVGNPLETTVCASRLIFSGVLDEMDDLRLVLMHGGGYLPYQIGRLDHGHRVRPESKGCRMTPSAYLTRFWYDTLTHAPAPLEFLVRQVGAGRVVYGTDFPFDMGGGSLAEQVGEAGFDEGDLARVAGANAAALFGLDARTLEPAKEE